MIIFNPCRGFKAQQRYQYSNHCNNNKSKLILVLKSLNPFYTLKKNYFEAISGYPFK